MPLTEMQLKIVQLTPGAGRMYCGNCLRDNALAAALERLGHSVCMVPLYLPLTLDEDDRSENQPVFFGGVNVYLQQKIPLLRYLPKPLRRLLDSRSLLRLVGTYAGQTDPRRLGSMTVSMLRGEEGRQVRELEELCDWLKAEHRPDVLCFSNALLLGMHRMLKKELNAKTVCLLTGEDAFLDALGEPHRTRAWSVLRERAAEVDRFVSPSRFFAEVMSERLGVPRERIAVIPNGLHTAGFETPGGSDPRDADGDDGTQPPVLGYFARMCPEKGLDLLVGAYIELRQRNSIPGLKLKIGGSCTKGDEPYVELLRLQLELSGLSEDVSFQPNTNREEKIRFLQSLDVFSVPARNREAFGLYVIEALAAGTPVVLPNRGAFPELLEQTGGGTLYEPNTVTALADALEPLLADKARCRELGRSGRDAVLTRFPIDRTAREFAELVF